ncbi:MAG: hypothetical protein IPJ86_11785 [Bacteroidetes bacterium]|nr:hypothetical protein [Bacteroidota bacterium]
MKKFGRRLALAVIFLFVGHHVNAQEVVARIAVDTNKILIGKPVAVLLQLSQPKSVSINWPLFTDSMGQMEILQVLPVDTLELDDDGILLRSQTITITSFDSGAFVIPEIIFNYRLPSGDKLLSSTTDPLMIEVFTVPVDTSADIRDIRNVEEPPFDPMIFLWILLIYHGVLLLMALVVWWIRKKNKKEVPQEILQSEKAPAHILALEALSALEEERIWQQGKHKAYYTRLTDILRVYIEDRWGVGALELTTDEIVNNSFVMTLEKQHAEELERVLRLSDLVKFAKLLPGAGENENAMQLSIKFVAETALGKPEKTEMLKES